MRIQDIRTLAKRMGIRSVGLGKGEIIRAIQRTEGNFECFGSTTDAYCDQDGCGWREDCLSSVPSMTAGKEG